jgi:hypothetical protein
VHVALGKPPCESFEECLLLGLKHYKSVEETRVGQANPDLAAAGQRIGRRVCPTSWSAESCWCWTCTRLAGPGANTTPKIRLQVEGHSRMRAAVM